MTLHGERGEQAALVAEVMRGCGVGDRCRTGQRPKAEVCDTGLGDLAGSGFEQGPA